MFTYMLIIFIYKRKEIMQYFISHTGTVRNEDSDFDQRTFFEKSGMTGVKTKCGCDYGKTISFYFDADEESHEEIANAIEIEIKAKYDNKFMHCDSCEEHILDEIKKEYI